MDFWLGLVVGWIASLAVHSMLTAATGRQAMSDRWRREQWREWRERDQP